VATTSGNVSRTAFKTTGSPMIIVMAIGTPFASRRMIALPEVNAYGLVTDAGRPKSDDAADAGSPSQPAE
jgi:hypothetical protein